MTHIIGNGLIAASCKHYLADDLPVTVFASGVSNVNASKPGQCQREQTLLKETLGGLKAQHLFIYFGTCSLFDPDERESHYCVHKLKMEKIVQANCEKSLILRLPQVVGSNGNPNNLVNFLCTHIKNQTQFGLWMNAHRTLLGVNDINLAINHLLNINLDAHSVINIAPCQPVRIMKIVEIMEEILQQKAVYREIEKGTSYQIDITLFEQFLSSVFPVRGEDYLSECLRTNLPT